MDRRGEDGIQPDPALGFRQVTEGVNRAGDGHRLGPVFRHLGMPRRAQHRRIGARGCAPRTVERANRRFAGAVEQNKAIATDAGHLRFADTEQNRPGDRRIHRIAPLFQDVDGGLCAKRMRRGAHPVAGINRGPSGQVKIAHCRLPISAGATYALRWEMPIGEFV